MRTPTDLKVMQSDPPLHRNPPDPQPGESVDASETRDLIQIMELVLRRFHFVVISIVIGVGLSAFVGLYVLPSYTAKTLLVVGDGQSVGQNSDDMSIDTQIAMLTSRAHLQRVLKSLWLDPRLRTAIPRFKDLEKHLKVMQELKSRVIAVMFTAKSPKVAAEVANRIATLYVEGFAGNLQLFDESTKHNGQQLEALNAERQSIETALGRSTGPASAELYQRLAELNQTIKSVKLDQSLVELREEDRQQVEAMSPPVSIFALATPPDSPSSLRPIFLIVPAFLASAILGTAMAVLLGRLNRLFYKKADLAAAFDVHCLGAVPDARRRFLRASSLLPQTGSRRARAIDSAIASVLLMASRRQKVILITSSKTHEGKSHFATNFAAAASRLHLRVLLIDLDILRTMPTTPLNGHLGLFDVLAGACSAGEATRRDSESPLDILSIGTRNEHPFVALGSEQLTKEFDRLKGRYDCIVINGPPVLDVTETRILAAKADQIILVVRARKTKQEDVSEALRKLFIPSSLAFGGQRAHIATILTTRPAKRRHESLKDWRIAHQARGSAASVVQSSAQKSVTAHQDPSAPPTPKTADTASPPGGNMTERSTDTQALAI